MTLDEFKNLSNEELIELFVNNNCSLAGIDKALGLSKTTSERLFNRRGIDYCSIKNSILAKEIDNYNKNPKFCKHCGKPIPWEKRENEYCCKSCTASENNKGKIRNPKGNVENLSKGWKLRERGQDAEQKIKELKQSGQYSAIIRSDRHNDIINSDKYKNYRLKEIGPGCCPICGEYNCNNEFCRDHNFQQLMGFVEHLGFDPKTIGTTAVFEEFNRVRNMVYDLYWNHGLSSLDLGKRFGYDKDRMNPYVFKEFGIDRKSLSTARNHAIISGKSTNPPFNSESATFTGIQQEWHTTWTGDNVFLRSSYETNYANWLDENQISYSVEELRIEYYDSQRNKTRIAIPDFYISSTNEIVEIKSDYTLDIQEMLDKFKAYKDSGYIPKLVLEGKEVDIYRIEEEIGEKRLNKIKNNNITAFKRNLKDGNQDSEISGE